MNKKRSEEEWKQILTIEQYKILREKRTELPFTGMLLHNKETGAYICAACKSVLFDSKAKFDSGTGWPSFDSAKKGAITQKMDNNFFMTQIEAVCANCGSHLGHIYDDGPTKTGKRFCINSCALNFKKSRGKAKLKKAAFGAGK